MSKIARVLGRFALTIFMAARPIIAQVPPTPPAPFDNVGNMADPNFDTDREAFEKIDTIAVDDEHGDGLGPVYNANSCATCHQDPVSGSSSEIAEIRAGRMVGNKFISHRNGSLVHQRAIAPILQQHVLPEDKHVTFRMSNTILGGGYVECINDADLIQNALTQYHTKFGDLHGTILFAPVPVDPPPAGPDAQGTFVDRIGRFGWKDQQASLLAFAADAYVNEMGITSPLQMKESPSDFVNVHPFDLKKEPEDGMIDDDNKDPARKDDFHPFGSDIEKFTRFMRGTNPPPRATDAEVELLSQSDPQFATLREDINAGELLFRDNARTGCAICHTPDFKTMPKGTPLPGYFVFVNIKKTDPVPPSVVPQQLAEVQIHPFSDFLMHNIGTGDGILQVSQAQTPSPGAIQSKDFDVAKYGQVGHAVAERFTAEVAPALKTPPLDAFALKHFMVPLTRTANPGTPPSESAPSRTDIPFESSTAVLPQSLTTKEANLFPSTLKDFSKTANMLRTAPLWGLRVRAHLLHDGSALTVEEAIKRHKGQAERVSENFENGLTDKEQKQVIAFLHSL